MKHFERLIWGMVAMGFFALILTGMEWLTESGNWVYVLGSVGVLIVSYGWGYLITRGNDGK
jgi:hypothetical protein